MTTTLTPTIANLGDPGIDRVLALKQAAGNAPNPAVIDLDRRAPLPFAELDAAGAALLEQFGAAQAVQDALEILDDAEVLDIACLVEALDLPALKTRLRNVAGGSLRAGRIDKALAAKCLELGGALSISAAMSTQRDRDANGARYATALATRDGI